MFENVERLRGARPPAQAAGRSRLALAHVAGLMANCG
jgi:hypothetical protein